MGLRQGHWVPWRDSVRAKWVNTALGVVGGLGWLAVCGLKISCDVNRFTRANVLQCAVVVHSVEIDVVGTAGTIWLRGSAAGYPDYKQTAREIPVLIYLVIVSYSAYWIMKSPVDFVICA